MPRHRRGHGARPAVLALVLLGAVLALGRPAPAEVFNPQTFSLDNGMQVVVVPNHRVPVVTHMVWYRVGSADDPPGKSGIAHFLEHLMFKGTEKLAAGDFSRILARNGGQDNAFTSYDYTVYHQMVAVDRLGLVMEMEADRMTNLVLSDEEIETERRVILEERRQRVDNNPAAMLREHVDAALFLNHPYRRPIIGWEHEIRTLTLDDIRAFYRRWYAPDNAVLVVAGDITAEQLRPLAEATYGRIARRAPGPRARPSEPPHRAARRVVLRDQRVRQPSWSRTFLAPSFATPDSRHVYPLEVLEEILDGGATSRLYRELVVERRLAVSAGAAYHASGLGPSRFTFYASPLPGVSMDRLESEMAGEIDRLLSDGVTAEEVERAKRRLLADAVYARDSLGTGAQVLGVALTTGRTVEDIEDWPRRIAAVTAEQIDAAAREVLRDGGSVTALLLGDGGE